jgi:flagellar assembly factor FliW
VNIDSTLFGTHEIDPGDVITFPQGMAGLEGYTRYKLFHEENKTPVVHWLQSLDEPDIAFSVVDPARFGLNYEIALSDEEADLLRAKAEEDEGDIVVLLIAYKPKSEARSGASINANINGPIILNTRTRLGMQKILAGFEVGVTLRGGEFAA